MITFLYGTGNPAKLHFMREALRELPVRIAGFSEDMSPPEVEETGITPLENARIKAAAYHAHFDIPVFSCDSGLFIEGLPDAEQPGVHVRTMGGKYLSDDEMLAHYSAIAARLGGACIARYRNAISLFCDGQEFYSEDEGLSGEKFMLVTQPHATRRPGFPLDAISVHIASGKYYNDLADVPLFDTGAGFHRFFSGVLDQLAAFDKHH